MHEGILQEAILGFDPPVPSNKLYDTTMGMPLFWGERKSGRLSQQIRKDIMASAGV